MEQYEENNCEKSQAEIDLILQQQDARRVSSFEASKLDKDAQKKWDIFYKRNETRFFKDRHWTLKEFEGLLQKEKPDDDGQTNLVQLLEVGCGVGNFIFPLLKEQAHCIQNVWACDFSPRAVDFVKTHPDYNEEKIKAFVCDIVQENCFCSQPLLVSEKVDFISLIFVLSAISPEKHSNAIKNLLHVSKFGTLICFRDYGRYDMAQLRFKGGTKIQDNFYARRDGTRAYYFTTEEIKSLFTESGHFQEIQCEYIHRRTKNLKEKIDVGRIFVQAKFLRI